MNRHDFITSVLAAGTYASMGGSMITGLFSKSDPFTLNYAPHIGMFGGHAGPDVGDQLRFMADMGFRAFEDNEMKRRSLDKQVEISQILQQREMQMGVFVAHTIGWDKPNITTGDRDLHNLFLKEVGASIEVARRMRARWMTVVPGRVDPKLEMEYQTANVVEALKRASELLEPHGLTIVIEPLNPLIDHPGQFLTKISQAYQICKAVDSPSCKILFDVYHQQITEGNLIPNIDYAWDEIAYFQVGDHPGRNEPTTGEINYRNIFSHLHRKGYDGIIGMEHGNSIAGKKGEKAVLEAYRKCDPK